jgi:excisionase family DNA binding protein
MSDNASITETTEKTPALPRLAYTMEETADILGVSYITVHRLLKRGLLRSSTALRHKLIPYSEIQRFLRDTMEE